MEFKLSRYTIFLQNLLDSGYTCLPFSDPNAKSLTGKHLLLRHDVDMDPSVAATMAVEEAKVGAKSTYFILLSNRHTNPFDKEFRAAVKEISRLGHWIGLHFDATQYELSALSADFNKYVHHEVALLKSLTGIDVDSVSFHRPARDLINSSHELTAPLNHTYERSFIEQMEYCSDSSGKWSYGPPNERTAIKDGLPFHFLTHPICWGHDELTPSERIRRWIVTRAQEDELYELPDSVPRTGDIK